jgi:ABC-2 type transport system ATP-binding protein
MNSLTGYKLMEKWELNSHEAVRFDNISVCYRIPNEKYSTFKEFVIRGLQGRIKHNSFWALKNVTFSVNKGEIFGIIGRNGAGKSTLLKLVARVMHPSAGRVVAVGHVAPLLEIGAGFHPDLTGRENITLNAAMLGFSHREILSKFDRIIEFAELNEFIDSPLRTYSTGMTARLGFAVATDTRPDILIVDEILGVGDEAFQQKCLDRILGFSNYGTTILLVSHSADMIQAICNRVAWLDHGCLVDLGSSEDMIQKYHKSQNIE